MGNDCTYCENCDFCEDNLCCHEPVQRKLVLLRREFLRKCTINPSGPEMHALKALSRKHCPEFDTLPPVKQAVVSADVIQEQWKEFSRMILQLQLL